MNSPLNRPNSYIRDQAIHRLRSAPWPSSYTTRAIELVQQNLTIADFIRMIKYNDEAPPAIDALCAIRQDSECVFSALRQVIVGNPRLSWILIESLNRLPFYSAMRAFLSLADPPRLDPSIYPFYILARNKTFIPTSITGQAYEYAVHGFWSLINCARNRKWLSINPNGLVVVDFIRDHLSRQNPDCFVGYLCVLLLGGIAPLESSTANLKAKQHKSYHTLIQEAATLGVTWINTTLRES